MKTDVRFTLCVCGQEYISPKVARLVHAKTMWKYSLILVRTFLEEAVVAIFQ